MIRGSKEVDSSTNEGSASDGKISKISSGSSTWLRLKDPRIVRVSRAFGGKDRHSKVCTIRGLKDRRVRLSVPTAIQLYDLQDRLGLNQPSKVVDWLLNAAKHEIDELPPLPVPPGNLGLNHHSMSSSQEVGASRANMVTTNINWEDHREEQPKSNVWSSDSLRRGKSKVVERETINEKEKQDDAGEGHASQDSSINMLPRSHNSSLPRLLNSVVSCGSYFHHLEPSSTFPLSQLGSHGLIPQTEDLQNFSVVPLPSGPQLLVCPPGTTQPLFPTHEIDPRQINHFQMLSSNPHNLFSNSLSPPLHSISQSMRPFHFSMTPRLLPSHNSSGSPSDKDQEFPSK